MVNQAGYSGTPLIKKLGLKFEDKIHLVSPPGNYFDLLDISPKRLKVEKNLAPQSIDFIHIFVKESQFLTTQFPVLKNALQFHGMFWISWPKKSSKVSTDVTEDLVRRTGLENGLVDVKICAVDEVWSGLKFVYRIKDRK